MKFEILSEVPRVAGTYFRQKTLETEIVWDGMALIPPTHFQMFRMSYHTGIFRGPNGEQWDYDKLREHSISTDGRFRGTAYAREAVDIEYWEDNGMDGHVYWRYKATYRVFLQPEEGDSHDELWLSETSGSMIMQALQEFVYDFNRKA